MPEAERVARLVHHGAEVFTTQAQTQQLLAALATDERPAAENRENRLLCVGYMIGNTQETPRFYFKTFIAVCASVHPSF